jgi:hypothetical protein
MAAPLILSPVLPMTYRRTQPPRRVRTHFSSSFNKIIVCQRYNRPPLYEKDILRFPSVARCTISLSNAETRLKWANIASHYKISARSYWISSVYWSSPKSFADKFGLSELLRKEANGQVCYQICCLWYGVRADKNKTQTRVRHFG